MEDFNNEVFLSDREYTQVFSEKSDAHSIILIMLKLHNALNSRFYFVGGQKLSTEIIVQFLNYWVMKYPHDQITDITSQTAEAVVFDVITKENMYEVLLRSKVVWSNLFREGYTSLKDCPLSMNSTLVLHQCKMTA